MKRKELRGDDLVNWWLSKYHNTTLDQIQKEHPELTDSYDFYTRYAVTQEQHDEWEKWAKEYVRKCTGYSKRLIERQWWSVYLDTSPMVIKETKQE